MTKFLVDIEPENNGPGLGTIIFWGFIIFIALRMCAG